MKLFNCDKNVYIPIYNECVEPNTPNCNEKALFFKRGDTKLYSKNCHDEIEEVTSGGQIGTNQYVHIKYSDDNINMTDKPTNNTKYIGFLVSDNKTPSAIFNDYDWVLIVKDEITKPDLDQTYFYIDSILGNDDNLINNEEVQFKTFDGLLKWLAKFNMINNYAEVYTKNGFNIDSFDLSKYGIKLDSWRFVRLDTSITPKITFGSYSFVRNLKSLNIESMELINNFEIINCDETMIEYCNIDKLTITDCYKVTYIMDCEVNSINSNNSIVNFSGNTSIHNYTKIKGVNNSKLLLQHTEFIYLDNTRNEFDLIEIDENSFVIFADKNNGKPLYNRLPFAKIKNNSNVSIKENDVDKVGWIGATREILNRVLTNPIDILDGVENFIDLFTESHYDTITKINIKLTTDKTINFDSYTTGAEMLPNISEAKYILFNNDKARTITFNDNFKQYHAVQGFKFPANCIAEIIVCSYTDFNSISAIPLGGWDMETIKL